MNNQKKMLTPDEARRNSLRKLFKALSKPFPEDAVERTVKAVTRKGYDTTGIKYQYIVDRLNEVLGVGCFRTEQAFEVREFQRKSGAPAYDVVCDITMWLGTWINGEWRPFAEVQGTGGHVSATLADAKKGAYTNGFKKTAAMLGVGGEAYRGTIDDDNVAGIDSSDRTPRNAGSSGNGMGNRLKNAQRAPNRPQSVREQRPRKGGQVPSIPGEPQFN